MLNMGRTILQQFLREGAHNEVKNLKKFTN